ncbi:hypothetical protein ABCS02_14135 [Microbacterium sp. X-17]|uniref:hypothetical protein n=1 Tax=Microbacterium sp. X-17 TaxID=3144404 RepID=UPI0031F4B1CE
MERSLELVRSPKLSPVGPRWYRYYAGFDPGFVADVCDALGIEEGGSVLDPWMGSGTTLGVAATRGVGVAGIDLNPAMVVVAKGRLLATDTLSSLEPLGTEILSTAGAAEYMGVDPLRHWLDTESAVWVRGLAQQIRRVLTTDETWPCDVDSLSSLASFYFVALFEAVTQALRAYGSRNPTWIKRATEYDGAVELSKTQLESAFSTAVKRLAVYLRSARNITPETHDAAVLSTGDSRKMPFAKGTFDTIVTSPPYLTRLDYVMGHAPELALLGYDGEEIRVLRDRMIGTPTRRDEDLAEGVLGTIAEQLLDRVRNHDSYAARSYYEPNFRQYFAGMAKSFSEIERVGKPGGSVLLVVQDSRFKDVHIDLAAALTSMGERRGWEVGPRKDFVNVRSMAQLNKNAHPLARSIKPVESAISFSLPRSTGGLG